jgi:hypothetical protein
MLFQYEKDIPWYKSKINLNLFSFIKHFQMLELVPSSFIKRMLENMDSNFLFVVHV